MMLQFAEPYGRMMAALIELMMPFYGRMDIYEVELVHPLSEWGYRLVAQNTQAIYVGRHQLPPGQEITAYALLSHSLNHITFFVIVVAGASVFYRYRIKRLLIISVLSLLLLSVIDVPFTLAASVEEILLMNRAALDDSLLVGWMNFLANGGRIGLALLAGWLVVLGSRIVPR